MRIVTLVASATETVCALDLGNQLVGRSHECDFPHEVTGLPVLSSPKVNPNQSGGTIDRQVREIVRDGLSVYNVNVEELERLRPDLIVTQDHCEVCAVSLKDVENALCSLADVKASICTLHPEDLHDVRRDFQSVADAAGVPNRGKNLVASFDNTLRRLQARVSELPHPTVALIEWLEPPMIAGGWMPEIARFAGAKPVIVTAPKSFETVTWQDIHQANPDFVVIMPCGYEIEKTLSEMDNDVTANAIRGLSAFGRGQCYVADGNAYFNRPGPRLADSAELLAALTHTEALPDLVEKYAGTYVRWGPT